MLDKPLKYSLTEKESVISALDTMCVLTNSHVFIKVLTEEEMKRKSQNDTFHALLLIFHKSGCHSFKDYKLLRENYKKIAGLFLGYSYRKGQDTLLSKEWVDVPKEDRYHAQNRFKSWSLVSKKRAKDAISVLISDMISSQVNNKEFDRMLEKWETDRLEYFGFV